ncbi:MAG: GNAT family N-acetyltransferase [Burkholderiales bacterium]|nr:MAG: GNAT family N-acetyltransferase [Burkholderiales bacterium]
MQTIQILPITASGAAFESATELFDQYRQFYGQAPQLQASRRFLHDRLSSGESTVLLASVGSQAAAFAQLYRGFSSIQCCQTVILNDLFVSPQHRSAGLGRHLVNAAIEQARESGAQSISLETAQDNAAAQRLYEACGFVRASGFFSYSFPFHLSHQEQ